MQADKMDYRNKGSDFNVELYRIYLYEDVNQWVQLGGSNPVVKERLRKRPSKLASWPGGYRQDYRGDYTPQHFL